MNLNDLERLVAELDSDSDCQTWAWFSYGEKCYAYAVVQAVPLDEDDDTPVVGRLEPHPEDAMVWVDESGRKCITLEPVFNAEHQNGGIECEVAVALRNAAPELFRRLREAETLLREARPMVEAAKEHFDRLKSSFVESMNYDAACRSRDNESAARNLAARIDKHLGGA
jgi:hypothetical protein